MKKMVKRLALIGVAALMAATVGVTASAKGHRGVGYQENIQAAANVVGESVESMIDRLQEYRCVGTLMAELGLLEEFQEEKFILASDRLNEYVENGTMSPGNSRCGAGCYTGTSEELRRHWKRSGQRPGNGYGQGNGVCDGTRKGQGNGVCDGTGNSQGNGICDGTGNGQGNGVCDGTGYGRGNGGGHGRGSTAADKEKSGAIRLPLFSLSKRSCIMEWMNGKKKEKTHTV